MGWRIIQLDSHLLGPPRWPLQDDSRKEIIEIHLDRLFLAHLETLLGEILPVIVHLSGLMHNIYLFSSKVSFYSFLTILAGLRYL
jgi:hypothetical protein